VNQASTRYREEELKEFGDVVSHVSWETAEAGLAGWLDCATVTLRASFSPPFEGYEQLTHQNATHLPSSSLNTTFNTPQTNLRT